MISWSSFCLICGSMIAYVLVGQWIGIHARRAWIQALDKQCRVELEGPLPLSFCTFFPYTAATRNVRSCLAEFMLDRKMGEHELSGNDLAYVRIHSLFWPLRLVFQIFTGIAALWVVHRARLSTDRQISKLEKRRLKLNDHIDTLRKQLTGVDMELDELIARRNQELKDIVFGLATDQENVFLEKDNLDRDVKNIFGETRRRRLSTQDRHRDSIIDIRKLN